MILVHVRIMFLFVVLLSTTRWVVVDWCDCVWLLLCFRVFDLFRFSHFFCFSLRSTNIVFLLRRFLRFFFFVKLCNDAVDAFPINSLQYGNSVYPLPLLTMYARTAYYCSHHLKLRKIVCKIYSIGHTATIGFDTKHKHTHALVHFGWCTEKPLEKQLKMDVLFCRSPALNWLQFKYSNQFIVFSIESLNHHLVKWRHIEWDADINWMGQKYSLGHCVDIHNYFHIKFWSRLISVVKCLSIIINAVQQSNSRRARSSSPENKQFSICKLLIGIGVGRILAYWLWIRWFGNNLS